MRIVTNQAGFILIYKGVHNLDFENHVGWCIIYPCAITVAKMFYSTEAILFKGADAQLLLEEQRACSASGKY